MRADFSAFKVIICSVLVEIDFANYFLATNPSAITAMLIKRITKIIILN